MAGQGVCGLHAGSSQEMDKALVSVEEQEPQEYLFSFWLLIFHCGQTILLKALSQSIMYIFIVKCMTWQLKHVYQSSLLSVFLVQLYLTAW